jgi:hypothetical protein
MATAIIKYAAADGKLFTTEMAANGHDKALSVAPSVQAYIEAAGLIKAGAGLVAKHIPAYLAFVEAQAATPAAE